MKFCVLDAWVEGDAALANSHRVAQWSCEALKRIGASVEFIEADAVTRARVDAAFEDPGAGGYLYCGHGAEWCLFRGLDASGGIAPLVDAENVAAVGGRWMHAFACLSGSALREAAASSGVACYAGYGVKVNVEWTDETLPDSLRPLLETLTTLTSVALAKGERSRGALRRAVRDASDALLTWWDQHPDEADRLPPAESMALQHLASLLHRRLEVAGAAVVE